MPARDDLIQATKNILWRKGYESMSPSLIFSESGAGQGSLYHHFSGKEGLALAALEEVEQELLAKAQLVLFGCGSSLERVKNFLRLKREPIKGCKIGRLVAEDSTLNNSLHKPIERYFSILTNMIHGVLLQAKEQGELHPNTDAVALANLVLTTVQGGFVISRAQNKDEPLSLAAESLCGYLDMLRLTDENNPKNQVTMSKINT